jgi:Mor family transcriptional regulator
MSRPLTYLLDMANRTSQVVAIADRLGVAELRVSTLRDELDAELASCHNAGCSIAELARASHLSRQSVYTAIDRARARQPA